MKNLLRNDEFMQVFFVVCLIFGIGTTLYGTVLAAESRMGIILTMVGVAMLLIGNIAHVRYVKKKYNKL